MKLKLQRALISVSDKTGVVELARALQALGVALLSTGGTAKLLQSEGIPVTEVADYTGYPEMLDGRVKTLHPKIHGGILARRDDAAHMEAIRAADTEPIDMVVVNLYPFAQTVARADCTLDEAIENIDIGGPSMVRGAAKNHAGVAVLTDPADYPAILKELRANGGALSAHTRFDLAKKAFAHTAAYDGAVANYLSALDEPGTPQLFFPATLSLQWRLVQTMRYGENPHQEAAFYRDAATPAGSLAQYRQIQGKELSYNNIVDADAAWECVKSFDKPACVVVKHANPCGVAEAEDPLHAYRLAYATDPVSAFGGIIAFNARVDAMAAEALVQQFAEVLVAPEYSADALRVLAAKPNVRVLQVPLEGSVPPMDMKRVGGGLLVQTPDRLDSLEFRVVTKRQPTPQEAADMRFAWRVAKYVKSNAIVFAREGRTLGIGAGQMSRVDSTRIAGLKAADAGLSLKGATVASDAFFPFRDGVDLAAAAGARAIIQPGGSMRDEEVIAAADEHGIAMIYTGVRHFRH